MADALEPQLPPQWPLETDIDMMLADDPRDYLSPDVVVFDATVPLTMRPGPASAILAAVEVVSRGSRREDRGSKPLAYAEAGVRHYFRHMWSAFRLQRRMWSTCGGRGGPFE